MDYEKKYKEALGWMQSLYNGLHGKTKEEAEKYFPELQESEDERIRKGIIDFLWKEKIFLQEAHSSVENNPKYRFVMDAIAWLEKQKSVGEIVERCKNSWYNEGKIAGMAEGMTDDEKYQQGWHDALEKHGEQNSTLSDEDKMMLNELIIGFYGYRDQYPNFWKLRTDEIIEWLKKKKDECTTDNRRFSF